MVRHSRKYVCQFADGVCRAARQAVPHLSDSAASRHEHRHDADQRGIADDALHPAFCSRRLRGALLHRLCHRRIAGRRGAAHRRRHFHQDRRHRLGPDEDRFQNQGRRRAQSRRDRRLHGRQRGRLGRAERRRLRDLRRHGRGAHHLHPAGREGSGRAGPVAGLDFRDAHRHAGRQRRGLLHQRRLRQGSLRQCRQDEFRGAPHHAGLAHFLHLHRDDLRDFRRHHSAHSAATPRSGGSWLRLFPAARWRAR